MAKRKTTLKAKRSASQNAKKAACAAGIVLTLGAAQVPAETQFLLGLYPNFSVPVSAGGNPLGKFAANDQLAFGLGGTARFTVRPLPFLDFFLDGSYNNYSYPFYEDGETLAYKSLGVVNASVGAGYNLPLTERLSLNAGLRVGASVINDKTPSLSLGASVGVSYRINPVVSVAGNVNGDFYNAQMIPAGFAPGVVLNFNEMFNRTAKVQLDVVDQQPVFPVLYSWYELNPFGTVRVANLEDSEIKDIKVSFYQPQYMSQPNLCAEMDVLGKEEYFDADLTAFFNERMLELTELTDTKAFVQVEYKYLGQKRVKEFPVTIPVYDRNSMNWSDDRRAASFVSSKDPAAMWFSKYITSIIRDNVRTGVPLNVQYAMGIFETLDQFGINYVIDPNSSYSENVGGESVDFLQFPYQTLMYRGGDCDDLSILTCSLFEAVGIKTAFITVPGHIYMAFDTGLSVAQAKKQFSDMSQLICREGRVWMPLEVTISDEGFSKAWRVGAREWNTADAYGEAAILPMEESWKIYRPISVPGATANFSMPDKRIVAKLFEHRIDEWVMRQLEPSIAEYRNALASNYNKATQNNLGVLYSRYGLFGEAEKEFKDLRKQGYIPAVVNTANVYFAKQSYNKALASYKAVLREEPMNELAILGVSRCNWELGNYRESDRYYEILKDVNPDLADEYPYLGSFIETKGRAYSLADRLDTLSWDIQESEEVRPVNSSVSAVLEAPDQEEYAEVQEELSQALPEPDPNALALAKTPEAVVPAQVKPVEEEPENRDEDENAKLDGPVPETASVTDDENRFEVDHIAEPEKDNFNAEEAVALEEKEEAEAAIELAASETSEEKYEGELPDFLFAEFKPVESDFILAENTEAPAAETKPEVAVTAPAVEAVPPVAAAPVAAAPVVEEAREELASTPLESAAREAAPVEEKKQEVVVAAPAVEAEPEAVAEAPAAETKPEVSVTTPAVEAAPEAVAEVPVAETKPEVAVAASVVETEPELPFEEVYQGELPDFLFADLKTLEPDREEVEPELAYSDEDTESETPEQPGTLSLEDALFASVPEVPAASAEIAQIPEASEDSPKPVFQDAWMKIPAKEEKVEEPVVDRAVPRFTESPSAEWAPEKAFTVAVIPGMRSFDEEMGNTQNEKAFLFQEDETESDSVENFDVFADAPKQEVVLKTEEVEAANPFGSFFDDELMNQAEYGFITEVAQVKTEAYEKQEKAPVQNETVKYEEKAEPAVVASVKTSVSEQPAPVAEAPKNESPAAVARQETSDNVKASTIAEPAASVETPANEKSVAIAETSPSVKTPKNSKSSAAVETLSHSETSSSVKTPKNSKSSAAAETLSHSETSPKAENIPAVLSEEPELPEVAAEEKKNKKTLKIGLLAAISGMVIGVLSVRSLKKREKTNSKEGK